jgi:hypothetical protein
MGEVSRHAVLRFCGETPTRSEDLASHIWLPKAPRLGWLFFEPSKREMLS